MNLYFYYALKMYLLIVTIAYPDYKRPHYSYDDYKFNTLKEVKAKCVEIFKERLDGDEMDNDLTIDDFDRNVYSESYMDNNAIEFNCYDVNFNAVLIDTYKCFTKAQKIRKNSVSHNTPE